MPKVTFIDFEGTRRSVDAEVGVSVMEVAIRNGVPGIDADCGGSCSCATCHVFVDETFVGRVGSANDTEKSMLEMSEQVAGNSRLSCQIEVTEELDGLVVSTPEFQDE